MSKIKQFTCLLGIGFAGAITGTAHAIPITTDVIAVVDESGSMSGEHAWLSTMIYDLDAAFVGAAGSDPLTAQYGLVGFGGAGSHLAGHSHDVGGSLYGSAADFDAATSGLVLNGGTEDGYSGISTALSYPSNSGALRNLILVTDEDRDNIGGGETYASISNALSAESALLNAVLNVNVYCGNSSTALGIDSTGTGYLADGAGGFSTCTGAYLSSGAGTSIADYANLAFGSGGAVWDLNQLRAGGDIASSFTSAFVDVKLQETISSNPGTGPGTVASVPEPGSLFLIASGLFGLFGLRSKMRKTA